MNDERKPEIERLFAAANRELADEAFVAGVMAKARERRGRNLVVALAVCVAVAPVAWLIAEPLNATLAWSADLLSRPMAPTGRGIAGVVLPMNSVAGALALTLLALRAVTRRLFSRGG